MDAQVKSISAYVIVFSAAAISPIHLVGKSFTWFNQLKHGENIDF